MNSQSRKNGAARLAGSLTLLLSAPIAHAACISVLESTYEAGDTEMGVAAVHWHVQLINECATSYDADIEIAFVDENDRPLYTVSELVSVPRQGAATAQREVYIPAPDFERTRNLVVTIVEERERPF